MVKDNLEVSHATASDMNEMKMLKIKGDGKEDKV